MANYWRVLRDVEVQTGVEQMTFFTGDLINPYATAVVSSLQSPAGYYIEDSGVLAPVPAGTAPMPVYGYVLRVDGLVGDVDLTDKYVQTVNGTGPDAAGNVDVAGGSGAVDTVNGVAPDGTGNVVLTPASIGAEDVDNKGVANGYAGLNASGHVPSAQLGSGTADGTTFLRGDGTFAAPPGGAAGTVTSVNSKGPDGTGNVDLTAADVGALTQAAADLRYPVLAGGLVPQAKLGSGTADSTHFLRGDGTWATVPGGGGLSTTPRPGIVHVASVNVPQAVKDWILEEGGYVCDGVNDQTEINLALKDASRPADGFGGLGYIGVRLIGPDFFTSQDGVNAVTMYPGTHLYGDGFGTVLQPSWPTNVDRGGIELLNASVAACMVSGMTIGHANASGHNGHGIKFIQNADASTYQINHGSDPYIYIRDINFNKAQQSGCYLTGTAGGCRETMVRDCIFWNANNYSLYVDSSDCEIIGCRANGGAGGFSAFYIAGGNSKLADCKAYFAESPADGFEVVSSRANLSDCDAQDNGRWGFNLTGDYVTCVGCVADSNARLTQTGGGFNIAASGLFSGIHAYNRNQTPSSPQQRAIVFTGSPNVSIQARTALDFTLAGSAHVTGAPDANSAGTITRKGATPIVYA